MNVVYHSTNTRSQKSAERRRTPAYCGGVCRLAREILTALVLASYDMSSEEYTDCFALYSDDDDDNSVLLKTTITTTTALTTTVKQEHTNQPPPKSAATTIPIQANCHDSYEEQYKHTHTHGAQSNNNSASNIARKTHEHNHTNDNGNGNDTNNDDDVAAAAAAGTTPEDDENELQNDEVDEIDDDVVVVLEGCESGGSAGKAKERTSYAQSTPDESSQSAAVSKTTTCAAKTGINKFSAITSISKQNQNQQKPNPSLPTTLRKNNSNNIKNHNQVKSVNKLLKQSEHNNSEIPTAKVETYKTLKNLNNQIITNCAERKRSRSSSSTNSTNSSQSSTSNSSASISSANSIQIIRDTKSQIYAPSTAAAALMSSAAAAAAGAAGGTLYGALLNQQQQQQQKEQSAINSTNATTTTTTSGSTLNTKSITNCINSPASASVSASASASSSPTSSLLTASNLQAALGNLFGANGFGSAKMLNELFGRQMKQAQDATSGLPNTLDNAMLAAAMESATSAELLSAAGLVNTLGLNPTNKLLNNNTLNSLNSLSNGGGVTTTVTTTPEPQASPSTPKNRRTSNCSERSLDGGELGRSNDVTGGSPPRAASVSSINGAGIGVGPIGNGTTASGSTSPNMQQQDLAHHMLRNILQGKKELMQFDQELRSVINQQQQQQQQQDNQDTLKHNNNNCSAANNNNNNNLSDKLKQTNNTVINLIEDTMPEIKIKSEPNAGSAIELPSPSGSSVRLKSSDSDIGSQHDDEQRSEQMAEGQEDDQGLEDGRHSPSGASMSLGVTKKEADEILEDVELMGLNSRSDLESLASPSHSDLMLLDNSKDDLEDELDKDENATVSLKKPGMDLKRARVENIVSGMRSSPSSVHQSGVHLQVNGCKKRKLYQPQQHAMERYVAAAAGLNFGLNFQSMMLDNEDTESNELESPQIQQKRVEKNALKSQLRSMQEQLAEMQQKYVQLCSRMEQESECQEIDDTASDSMEQDEHAAELSPSPSLTGDSTHNEKQASPQPDEPEQEPERANSTSPTLKLSNKSELSTQNSIAALDNAPNMLSQMMSKMMSTKMHNPLVNHPGMQQSFNGPLPLLQHMDDMSHAAAMYQQFFFEQEARMAKEAAEQQERQQQQQVQQQQAQQQQQQLQQAQQQQQHQQEQQEQQRRFQEEQEQRRKEEQQQQQQAVQVQQQQQQHQQQQLQRQQQQLQQQLQQMEQSTPPTVPTRPQLHHHTNRMPTRHANHSSLKSEFSEKFNMLRSNSNSMMRISASDLEGLFEILNSEIKTSVSSIIDSVFTRFVHQRRLFSKQADSVAAAAEQLNKDLLLASQILDRKSPRTKVADRSHVTNSTSHNGSSSAAQNSNAASTQSGNNGSLLLANSQMSSSSTPGGNAAANANASVPINTPSLQQQQPQQQPQHAQHVQQQQQHQQQQQQLQQQHQLQSAALSNGVIAGPGGVNVPQHPLAAAAAAAAAANQSQSNAAMSAMAAAAAAAQNCQNLIAAPRLNGNQLSFPSPAAAAAAAMGLQMHHAAAAAAMSAAAANQQHAQQVQGGQDAGAISVSNQNLGANTNNSTTTNNSLSTLNIPPPHIRPSPTAAAMFQAPKTPQGMNPVAAAALYNSIASGGPNPFCLPDAAAAAAAAQQQQQQQTQQQQQQQQQPNQQPTQQQLEQNEALSLVVTPKKKRHKVTDTRITPRTVSRILAQDGVVPPSANGPGSAPGSQSSQGTCNNTVQPTNANITPAQSPSPRSQASAYHPPPPPPPMMPVSLPTSVAIPNPSLHESQVFSPYSPFFNPHAAPPAPHGPPHAPPTAAQMHHMKLTSSPPGGLGGLLDSRESPPLPHPPTMLHPALLAAAHHGASPDYSAHLRAAMDAQDRQSDCNSAEMQFDGMQPTSSTLTPMHLRKAKLMFFWVRYPSSAVLKMYFPDIKFNKNNTAQLVKWFSNFREFYYIQMEKYARQAVTEGIKTPDDLHIAHDNELYRVLNLHYNRNNHIEVPQNFRFVVEQTLREFFRAIQGGKDTEQSWKKSIYKIISRMDDPVPEYFKTPNFLEQLE